MIRRSRISVRPNVGRPGRAGGPAASQEAPNVSPNKTPAESTVQAEDNNSTTAVESEDNNNSAPAGLTPEVQQKSPDDHGEASTSIDATPTTSTPTVSAASPTPTPTTPSSTASIQRRKRFAVKPKVTAAPNRASARQERNQQTKDSYLGDLPPGASDAAAAAAAAAAHVDPTALSHMEDAGAGDPPAAQETQLEPAPPERDQNPESLPASPAEEVPPKPPDKALAPPSLPEREVLEISEKARTLVAKSCKVGPSLPKNLSHLLHDQMDQQRLAQAQKLRDLLRQEMCKEKEKTKLRNRKSRCRVKEYSMDTSKMTMRDLIHYLPASNPMSSYLEESTAENETVVPASPAGEVAPENAQAPREAAQGAEEDHRDVEEEEEEDDGEGDAMMVPRVKVAEDGSLIIDEESLTVEVKRVKGPNPATEQDAVFERGSTTTYSSFRKKSYTKAWSNEETDMFFLAVSMVGTDFSMICQLFPHRARSEIKNKFKKEERMNSWRVDKACKERRRLDVKFFTKLLEKILEFQNKKKKKARVPSERKTTGKPRKKANVKSTAIDLSDVEEEDLEEEEEEEGANGQEDPDYAVEQGEVDNPPESPKDPASTETPVQKPKNKGRNRSKKEQQAEASVPEEAEAALPEDHSTANEAEDAESVTHTSSTKPSQPQWARAFKPLLPLHRNKGKAAESVAIPQDAPVAIPQDAPDAPVPNSQDATIPNSQEAPGKVQTLSSDDSSSEQVDKDCSPFKKRAKKRKLEYEDSNEEDDDDPNDEHSSQDEEVSCVKLKPTRYGRMPKATQHLVYPAKEDSAPDRESPGRTPTTSTPRAKRPPAKTRSSKTPARESKKPTLVTLRASQSDCSDEEEEDAGRRRAKWVGLVEEEEEEDLPHGSEPSGDSCAPVFVPASLRSPNPVVSVVEETMEEFHILVNVPEPSDPLQDPAHHMPCEHAQNETDSLPFEHSLDLLADVIDFLSPEQMGVSDNEAAHTLLTIGNRSLQSLLAHIEGTGADCNTEMPSISDPDTLDQNDPSCDFQSPFLPPEAPMPAVDSTHQDSRAPHDDPGTLTDDDPIPDTPGESSGSIPRQIITALTTEPEPLHRAEAVQLAMEMPLQTVMETLEEMQVEKAMETPEETPVLTAMETETPLETPVQTSVETSKRGRLPKVKPNLLRPSRVGRLAQKPTSRSPKADGTTEALTKQGTSEEMLLPAATAGPSSVPLSDWAPQTPARQEETAGRGQSFEAQPQSETSVKVEPLEDPSAKKFLEPGSKGSETGMDSASSHPSMDVQTTKVKLPDSEPNSTEVVPPSPMVTGRRPLLKVKPKLNVGQRIRAPPSVQSKPTETSPDLNPLSSEPQITEHPVTQSQPESTCVAVAKAPCPTPPSPVLLTKAGCPKRLAPPTAREDRDTSGLDSPAGSQTPIQPAKENISNTSKQGDTPVPPGSEPQPAMDLGPRLGATTQPGTDRYAAAASSEPSGCTDSQRSGEDRVQESSGPDTTRTSQREERSSKVQGGLAGGDRKDCLPAPSEDSVPAMETPVEMAVETVLGTETAVETPVQTSVETSKRGRLPKVKPNLLRPSRVGRLAHKPTSRSPKADGTTEALTKQGTSEEMLLPAATAGPSSVPLSDWAPQTPARQEETAGRGQSFEVQPQSETSVKVEPLEDLYAKKFLEPGLETAKGSETGMDSASSHPSMDVQTTKVKLPASEPNSTKVVPPSLTVTGRRPLLKVKPKLNVGQRIRAPPSVESKPTGPDLNPLSSEPQITEDPVTQSQPESTCVAVAKTPYPTPPSPVLLTKAGCPKRLAPPTAREDRDTSGLDSPAGSQTPIQPAKENISQRSGEDRVQESSGPDTTRTAQREEQSSKVQGGLAGGDGKDCLPAPSEDSVPGVSLPRAEVGAEPPIVPTTQRRRSGKVKPNLGPTASTASHAKRPPTRRQVVGSPPDPAPGLPKEEQSLASVSRAVLAEGLVSGHSTSWLVEDPFTAVDAFDDEQIPGDAAPTAPPAEPPAPPDPEEPFFILSLTEIPVSTAAVGGRAVPSQPPADHHHQHQHPVQTTHGTERPDGPHDSDPVRVLEVPESEVGPEPESISPDPPSQKRKACSGTVRRKKPAACPAADELSEVAAGPAEKQDPPSKRRRGPGARQRAKVEVQPSSTGGGRARRTAEAQPKGSGGTPAPPRPTGLLEAERAPEEAADAAAARPIDSQASSDVTPPPKTPTLKRKPKGFLSFLSDPATPGPSGTPRSKVRAPQVKMSGRVARKPGLSLEGGTVEMPLKDVSVVMERLTPTCRDGAVPVEPQPRASGCTAEVDHADQDDPLCVKVEEPTNISQYFLSDIFTDVDD